MNGFFGDEDALLFEIDLIASDALELPLDAMFDTGLKISKSEGFANLILRNSSSTNHNSCKSLL